MFVEEEKSMCLNLASIPVETLSKLEMEGNFFILIQDVYEKWKANILRNGERP